MSTDTNPTFESVLADAGFNVVAKAPTLKIAPDLFGSLRNGTVRAFTFGKDAPASMIDSLRAIEGVSVFSSDSHDAARLRQHVTTKAKSLKFPLIVNGNVKNADGDTVGHSYSLKA